MKIKEYSFSLAGKAISRLSFQDFQGDPQGYIQGTVLTPYGIVDVFSQGDKKSFHHTRLEVIKNGRNYARTFNKRYTKRGLVTLARKFAYETVG